MRVFSLFKTEDFSNWYLGYLAKLMVDSGLLSGLFSKFLDIWSSLVQKCVSLEGITREMLYLAREWTVRPFFRSPTIVIVSPLTVPISSLMVKISNRAWVGCSPTPLPALINGLRQWADAFWNQTFDKHTKFFPESFKRLHIYRESFRRRVT